MMLPFQKTKIENHNELEQLLKGSVLLLEISHNLDKDYLLFHSKNILNNPNFEAYQYKIARAICFPIHMGINRVIT
jgi:hypothetical protein